MTQKRKRPHDDVGQTTNGFIDTSKPTAIYKPTGERRYTVSVAIPGSIIANAVSHDQKTYLAGTIARALAVFCVDEVVVFNDGARAKTHISSNPAERSGEYTALSDPCHFLAHVLSFLETPPYLRKTLFPMHPNLKTAGTLPSLDMPHHLRRDEWCDYREGVVAQSSVAGSEIDVGLQERRLLKDLQIPVGTRVTLGIEQRTSGAKAVTPSVPREKLGIYWGYAVRQCGSLSSVLTECPFDGGYDLCFGTSERGQPLQDVLPRAFPAFEHLMVVFGGVAGLETAARNDTELAKTGITAETVGELFDQWVNILPGQGSRTIRTEEAIWLGLMGLSPLLSQRRAADGEVSTSTDGLRCA